MDALHRWDVATFRAINLGWHSRWLDPVFEAFSYSGLGWSVAIFIAALLILPQTRQYVIPLALSSILAGFIYADGLKQLIPRDRPSQLAWAIAEEPHRTGSFPSGHTSLAFGFATAVFFLTAGTPRAKWGWVAYLWAVGVALSRMYRGVHWPTDVLAGVLGGLFCGCLVTSLYPQPTPERGKGNKQKKPKARARRSTE